MTTIRLTTWVNAPVERCFLLATSRDFSSSSHANGGHAAAQGSLGLGDQVGWKAGNRSYVSRVDAIRPYNYFREVMVAGIFSHFEHDHHFARMDDGTRVRDEIRFSTRLGPLGRAFEMTVLRTALGRMLVSRNTELKRLAESSEWQRFVETPEAIRETIAVNDPQKRITNMQRFA
jgi:ligand-binding SRPBCC domain-containing protein